MLDATNTVISPKEALSLLIAMDAEYTASLHAKEVAEKDLGDVAAADAAIEAIRARAVAIAAAITAEKVTPLRAGRLIFAAAAGLSALDVKKIAEANRTSQKDADGIVLPIGRFENLSRGKGWCRLGSGNNATWADRADKGGYKVTQEGKWTVGSSDGFSRKDQTPWDVRKVGQFWIAN